MSALPPVVVGLLASGAAIWAWYKSLPPAPRRLKQDLSEAEVVEVVLSESKRLGVDPAAAMAVLQVESGGSGYGKDGALLIRFEPHIFEKYSGRERPLTERAGQAAEYRNLERAALIDKEAALLSTSLGAPQIMGFNYKSAGFSTVQAMWEAFTASERFQVLAFFRLIDSWGLVPAIREKNFLTFAKKYNGKGQKGYDQKMANAYELWKLKLAKGYGV